MTWARLVEEVYSDAERVTLVQDNLSAGRQYIGHAFPALGFRSAPREVVQRSQRVRFAFSKLRSQVEHGRRFDALA